MRCERSRGWGCVHHRPQMLVWTVGSLQAEAQHSDGGVARVGMRRDDVPRGQVHIPTLCSGGLPAEPQHSPALGSTTESTRTPPNPQPYTAPVLELLDPPSLSIREEQL